jgi:hypothetical protein
MTGILEEGLLVRGDMEEGDTQGLVDSCFSLLKALLRG